MAVAAVMLLPNRGIADDLRRCRTRARKSGILFVFLDFFIHLHPIGRGRYDGLIGNRLVDRYLKGLNYVLDIRACIETQDAPWPATKEELIDYAVRSGAPLEVLENLQEIEDEGDIYESIEDIWPDYPSKDDFFFNEEEY